MNQQRVSQMIGAVYAFALLCFAQPAVAAVQQDDARRVDDALQVEINASIDQGVEFLLQQQHRDGSWTGSTFGSYPSGATAFTAFTLVESGVPKDSPAVRMALRYLKRNPPKMTYSAGALLLLLAELGDDAHEDWAQQALDQLVAWESGSLRGAWSYPSGPVDLSNTQFVALGFWAADRMGLEVPIDVSKRMVETTIDAHQEQGRDDARGFTYFPGGVRDRPASGSMTCAGICIQQIARQVHGKKLGGKLGKAMKRSEEAGLAWLEKNWTYDFNPGHPDGGQVLYFYYAIERVASFYEWDEMFGTPWYASGARRIVDKQEDTGSWGKYHQTCYSLLFLNRASRAFTPEGTARGQGSSLRSGAAASVVIRATPGLEIIAWVDKLTSIELQNVQRVEWWAGSELIETDLRTEQVSVPRDFSLRWRAPQTGSFDLQAKVFLGDESPFASTPLAVDCSWTAPQWMAAAEAGMVEYVRLDPKEWGVTASSEAAGQHAARLIDGWQGTPWIAGGSDVQAQVTLKAKKGVYARRVVVSQAGTAISNLPIFRGVTRVRLIVNGKSSEHEIPSESAGPIEIEFGKRVKVRELQIEILDATTGPGTRLGFAELWLLDRR